MTDQQTLSFDQILQQLPTFRAAVPEVLDVVLANLAMISEIPAPTFKEDRRIEFLQSRFSDFGLQDCSQDEVGNVVGILRGSGGGTPILAIAHVDTSVAAGVDHTITLKADRMVGATVSENSLGVAVLNTLPLILEKLQLQLRSDVVVMGTTRSLGRGNLRGLRFFLENTRLRFSAGVSVESIPLGRLSYSSIGMMRGEVRCTVPEEYDWTRFGTGGAIMTINEVVNKMLAIPLPKRPRTTIVLGEIEGGTSAQTIATHAALRFEVRSESGGIVRSILQQVHDITREVAAHSGELVELEIFARCHPGGIAFTHPMTEAVRRIMGGLDLSPRLSPSTSELAAFIDERIPAITIGITRGEHTAEPDEMVLIEPMATGVAQLVGILLAIDGGYCTQ